MGPSGSGKTTLLNLIGGLDNPSGGEISIEGERIDQMSGGQLSTWRSHHVGFVFQFYNLMPMLTAQKNVELPLLLTHLNAAQRRRNAEIALTLVGLADRRSHRPNELSGGQQQRVAIARAIVSDPTFLICDEPTGDLDRQSAEEILGLLQQLNREHGKTIIMVTHDPKAAEYATHTVHRTRASWPTRRWPTDGGHGDEILSLVWAQLFRSRTRTLLTLLSVVAAFLLFGMLDSVRVAFSSGGSVEGANRLIVASRLSITQSLPIRPETQVRQVAGVRDVAYGMWFGGIYQDPKNFFPNFSVSPTTSMSTASCRSTRHSWRTGSRPVPAPSSAKPWPSSSAGRSATPSRCRPRSSRVAAATTGRWCSRASTVPRTVRWPPTKNAS